MGISKRSSGLASALFSHVQLRVLGLLFGQADREFQVTELIQLASSGRGAVQRELEKLAEAGLVKISMYGNRKAYQANRQSPIFQELRGLIMKTVGLIEPLRAALQPFRSEIDAAFVYGSIAKGKDTAKSDIDIMILGNELTYTSVFAALHKAENKLLRAVNPNLMTTTEWKRKVAEKSPFVSRILQQPKLFVLGSENELKGIRQLRSSRNA